VWLRCTRPNAFCVGRRMVATWSRPLAVGALLALSTVIAAGSPAITERSVHLRAGPGTSYRVVAMLPRGAAIDVSSCIGGWCEVPWGGARTYVAQSFLALQSTAPAAVIGPTPPHAIAPDPSYVIAPDPSQSDDYPGFDFPTAYAPAVTAYPPAAGMGPGGTAAVPRWSHRRWSAWRHRYGRAWTSRSYAAPTALGPAPVLGPAPAFAPARTTFGRADEGTLVPLRGSGLDRNSTSGTAGSDLARPPVPPLPIPNVAPAGSGAAATR
jgi:uncharacterized protein YraI